MEQGLRDGHLMDTQDFCRVNDPKIQRHCRNIPKKADFTALGKTSQGDAYAKLATMNSSGHREALWVNVEDKVGNQWAGYPKNPEYDRDSDPVAILFENQHVLQLISKKQYQKLGLN